MNEVDRMFKNNIDNTAGFIKNYFDYLSQVFEKIDKKEIEQFIEILIKARIDKSTIFFIGNGGSAATASHFANDISIGTRALSKPFKAISLCDNAAVVTAIANDDGYEEVFVQQLRVLYKKNDILVAISASGNSMNLMKAIKFAKENEIKTVGITAFDGGKLKQVADYNIHVPTEKGEYGPAEDVHMILDHLIGAYLTRMVKEENN